MVFRTAASFLALMATVGTISAADWPQWRGPARDGVSAETGLLKSWPKDGPTLSWKVEDAKTIGTGYGSPAVVGDKIYLLGGDGATKTAKEMVTCLNLKDGSKVWQTPLTTSAGDFLDGWGGGPRSTPTVDGEFIYVLGAQGDLTCLTKDKGDVKWTKNLEKDLGGVIPKPWWGFSESPLVDGDNVIVTPGGKGGVTALDKKTGAVAWVCKELTDEPQYSSLVITEVGGVKQYVTQTFKSAVGVRAKDGKLLWKVGAPGRSVAVIPTPVIHDGYAFFTAGYGFGCECFKLEKDGEGTKATEVYPKNRVMMNHHGGVIRVEDMIYGHTDAGNKWICYDFKKGPKAAAWEAPGVGKGSVTLAEGMLYCYSEKNGALALVKASPKEYEEVSKFVIPSVSKIRPKSGLIWAHPVIANGKLILRDYEKLFVYDIAAK